MKLNELEIKIQLDSQAHFNQIFQICTQQFGPPTSHVRQLNEYFDTPDDQLRKQDLVMRIRQHGDECLIALKSPRIKRSSGLCERIELEFAAADGRQVHKQLTEQGLILRESAEKERWTFVHLDIEIVLDRLPFLGMFVEIEGPNEAAIDSILKILNLSNDQAIDKNYCELMQDKFRELNLPENYPATFTAEAQLNLKPV